MTSLILPFSSPNLLSLPLPLVRVLGPLLLLTPSPHQSRSCLGTCITLVHPESGTHILSPGAPCVTRLSSLFFSFLLMKAAHATLYSLKPEPITPQSTPLWPNQCFFITLHQSLSDAVHVFLLLHVLIISYCWSLKSMTEDILVCLTNANSSDKSCMESRQYIAAGRRWAFSRLCK